MSEGGFLGNYEEERKSVGSEKGCIGFPEGKRNEEQLDQDVWDKMELLGRGRKKKGTIGQALASSSVASRGGNWRRQGGSCL